MVPKDPHQLYKWYSLSVTTVPTEFGHGFIF